MAMTDKQKEYVQLLREGKPLPAEYIKGYYGLDWPFKGKLQESFGSWLKANPVQLSKNILDTTDTEVRPELVEFFLQDNGLLTKKWLAARLGVTESSLGDILDRLDMIGMQRERYRDPSDQYREILVDDLKKYLPKLRSNRSADHEQYRLTLHNELAKKLEITIDKQFCDTSMSMRDNPKHLAEFFDCITFEPLCRQHAAWMELPFRPIALAPARCSKRLVADNLDILSELILQPDDQNWLEQYQNSLAGAA